LSLLSVLISTDYDSTNNTHVLKLSNDLVFGDIEWFLWFIGHFSSFILLIWGLYWLATTLIYSLVTRNKYQQSRFTSLKHVLEDGVNVEPFKLARKSFEEMVAEDFVIIKKNEENGCLMFKIEDKSVQPVSNK
jgi:hypothetical protein